MSIRLSSFGSVGLIYFYSFVVSAFYLLGFHLDVRHDYQFLCWLESLSIHSVLLEPLAALEQWVHEVR